MKKRKQELNEAEKTLSFTKKLVIFIILISELEILLSYVLAFVGMPIIAEELSSTVVTVCLGSIGFYTIKALVENLSKYSNIFGGNYKLLKEEKEDDSNNDNNEDDSFNAPISTTDSMSDNAQIEIDNIENNLDIDDIITD